MSRTIAEVTREIDKYHEEAQEANRDYLKLQDEITHMRAELTKKEQELQKLGEANRKAMQKEAELHSERERLEKEEQHKKK